MGSFAIFKAELVGGLGFIIALGIIIVLWTSISNILQNTSIKVSKLPALITLMITWFIGWGGVYWYFVSIKNSNVTPDQIILTIFACLLTLTPSVAMVCAFFTYYNMVHKAVNGNK